MKAGWQTKTIGEVCGVVNGGTPKTGVNEFWDGDNQWITPAEMGKRESPYVNETKRQITEQGLKNSSAKLLPPKSVILSTRAPIGHLVINTEPMATNQGCKGLIPSDNLHYKYLFYYLGSEVELLNSLGTGATFKELSGDKLKEVRLPIAPLPEQQRIVSILDEVFEGIATATANAEKNLNNARELFESELQTVFTRKSDDWTHTSFGELATFRNGINFTESSTGQSIKIIGVKDFQQHFWAPLDNLESVNPDATLPDTDLVQENDILFVRSNGNKELIGRCLLAGAINERTTFSGFTIRARINGTSVMAKYICHFLKSKYARRKMIEGGNGVNIKSLNQETLSSLTVSVPSSIKEQQAIIAKLDELSAETKRLESIYQQKLTALNELKKSILHQAFVGEL